MWGPDEIAVWSFHILEVLLCKLLDIIIKVDTLTCAGLKEQPSQPLKFIHGTVIELHCPHCSWSQVLAKVTIGSVCLVLCTHKDIGAFSHLLSEVLYCEHNDFMASPSKIIIMPDAQKALIEGGFLPRAIGQRASGQRAIGQRARGQRARGHRARAPSAQAKKALG